MRRRLLAFRCRCFLDARRDGAAGVLVGVDVVVVLGGFVVLALCCFCSSSGMVSVGCGRRAGSAGRSRVERVESWNTFLTFPVMRVAAMKSRKDASMLGSLVWICCQSIFSGHG